MRLQLALNVRDLDEAVRFYSALFGATPHKRRDGYANFALENPPLKLVLFEAPDASDRLNHLGVEVFSDDDIDAARARLTRAGLPTEAQRATTCCHATQNKVWSEEPQGLRWEWYRVLNDEPAGATAPDPLPCCEGLEPSSGTGVDGRTA